MYVIPFQLNASQYSVFIVLQEENLERIRQYDPAEVSLAKVHELQPQRFEGLKLKDVLIGYGTDADVREALHLLATGAVRQGLQLLSRGFRYRPDAGDHDGPYKSLRAEGDREAG
jgi:hypothetical protein